MIKAGLALIHSGEPGQGLDNGHMNRLMPRPRGRCVDGVACGQVYQPKGIGEEAPLCQTGGFVIDWLLTTTMTF